MMDIPLALWNTLMIHLELGGGLVVVLFRRLLLAACLAVFVGACLLFGARTTVGVIFYTPICVFLWWAVGKALAAAGKPRVLAAYQRVLGRWLKARLRRWWLYGRRWDRVMKGAMLATIIDRGRDEVPKLKKVTATPVGDALVVRVLPGHSVEEWERQAQSGALHKAFSTWPARWCSARQCRVYDEPGNLVRVEVAYGASPLEQVIPHPGVPPLEAVDLHAVPVGITEQGEPFTVPVLGSSLLVAGVMGSGKGGAMWSIILGLAPMVREGTVRLWGYDGKGGMELRWCRDLFEDRYCEGDMNEAADMLGLYAAAMRHRTDQLGGKDRKLTPSREHPLEVLIIDEFARLTGKTGDRALDLKLDTSLRDIINIGRAPGYPLIGFLQNPTQETLRHRNEIANFLALRLTGRDRGDLILGRGARRMGAKCDQIPRSLPGVGYAQMENVREPMAFRLFMVDDAMLSDCNARYAPRPALAAVPVPA